MSDICVDAVYTAYAYLGLMLGIPDDETNKDFIDRALLKATKLFGDPVHLIQPEIKYEDVDFGTHVFQSPRLPDNLVIANIRKFIVPDYHITTVVFYVDCIENNSIRDIVLNQVKDLDWNTLETCAF